MSLNHEILHNEGAANFGEHMLNHNYPFPSDSKT
jgi:hypothetical protein